MQGEAGRGRERQGEAGRGRETRAGRFPSPDGPTTLNTNCATVAPLPQEGVVECAVTALRGHNYDEALQEQALACLANLCAVPSTSPQNSKAVTKGAPHGLERSLGGLLGVRPGEGV